MLSPTLLLMFWVVLYYILSILWGCVLINVHTWKSEDTLQVSFLSFQQRGPGTELKSAGLASNIIIEFNAFNETILSDF